MSTGPGGVVQLGTHVCDRLGEPVQEAAGDGRIGRAFDELDAFVGRELTSGKGEPAAGSDGVRFLNVEQGRGAAVARVGALIVLGIRASIEFDHAVHVLVQLVLDGQMCGVQEEAVRRVVSARRDALDRCAPSRACGGTHLRRSRRWWSPGKWEPGARLRQEQQAGSERARVPRRRARVPRRPEPEQEQVQRREPPRARGRGPPVPLEQTQQWATDRHQQPATTGKSHSFASRILRVQSSGGSPQKVTTTAVGHVGARLPSQHFVNVSRRFRCP